MSRLVGLADLVESGVGGRRRLGLWGGFGMCFLVGDDGFHLPLALMELAEPQGQIDPVGGKIANREQQDPGHKGDEGQQVDGCQAGDSGPGDPGITEHQQDTQDSDEIGNLLAAADHRLQMEGFGVRFGLVHEGFPLHFHAVHSDGNCENCTAECQWNQQIEDRILEQFDGGERVNGRGEKKHLRSTVKGGLRGRGPVEATVTGLRRQLPDFLQNNWLEDPGWCAIGDSRNR